MISRASKFIIGLLLLCFFAPIVTLTFIYYYDWKPFVLLNEDGLIKIINLNKTVCAGDLMRYVNVIDKRMPGACVVKRQLVNSYVINYDPVEPPEKELGKQAILGTLHVPSKADPGDHWFMRWSAECDVTFLKRKMIINGISEKFTVVDCSKPATPQRGAKGEKGDTGGFSIFGGKQGKQGPKGEPGKDCSGDDCK